MSARNEKKETPVKPYDDSLWDRYSMYDKMPYVWDTDLNVERAFTKVTGNVIKSYRCKMNEPLEIKND